MKKRIMRSKKNSKRKKTFKRRNTLKRKKSLKRKNNTSRRRKSMMKRGGRPRAQSKEEVQEEREVAAVAAAQVAAAQVAAAQVADREAIIHKVFKKNMTITINRGSITRILKNNGDLLIPNKDFLPTEIKNQSILSVDTKKINFYGGKKPFFLDYFSPGRVYNSDDTVINLSWSFSINKNLIICDLIGRQDNSLSYITNNNTMYVTTGDERKDLYTKLNNAFTNRVKYKILPTSNLASNLQSYFMRPILNMSIFNSLKEWWLEKNIKGDEPNIIFENALKSTAGKFKENTECYVESIYVNRHENTAFTLSKGPKCNIGWMQRARNRNNIFIKDIGRGALVSTTDDNNLTISNVYGSYGSELIRS